MEGLKAVLLINGGAIVALLAFLGQSTLGPELAEHFRQPIRNFAIGLCLATLAFLCSYFTQLALYNESPNTPSDNRKRKLIGGILKHEYFLWPGIALFVFSIGAFGYGALLSVDAFAEHGKPAAQAVHRPEPKPTK